MNKLAAVTAAFIASYAGLVSQGVVSGKGMPYVMMATAVIQALQSPAVKKKTVSKPKV